MRQVNRDNFPGVTIITLNFSEKLMTRTIFSGPTETSLKVRTTLGSFTLVKVFLLAQRVALRFSIVIFSSFSRHSFS